ncbi:LLM class flavin-dependent oxidoreductase [bacterium]|nr:LLM class flavin-dependent oxidoreductase [bacterium]
MEIINEIKSLAAEKGVTLTYIAEQLSIILNKNYTVNNLSTKLRLNRIRYSEIKIILDILGKEFVIKDKEN